MPDQPALIPEARRPVIPPEDWRLITAGCKDRTEIGFRAWAYQLGYSAGQRSISDSVRAAMRAAIDTPRAPDEPGLLCEKCGGRAAVVVNGMCGSCRPDNRRAEMLG